MSNDTHERLQIKSQPVAKQDPRVRINNWQETFLGFSPENAKLEAMRCIQCPDAPCQAACPVGNDIPGALLLLEQGDPIAAANKFRETNHLPEMCGRLCPQESLCEGDCVVGYAIRPEDMELQKPVAIGKLESFVSDTQRITEGLPMPEIEPPTGQHVAVVGAGPAGMAVAEELAKKGHKITLFDSWSEPGGVLLYGIPNFKMQKEILDDKLEYLWKLGIVFQGDTYVGRDVSIEELFEQGYQAVFLGFGASQGNQLDAPGADLPGVLMATEYLVRGNLKPEQLPEWMREPLPAAKRLLVIGGGDTSMDCVRTAVRLGAEEVTCVYRRTEAEQKGRIEERVHAVEEGVRFEYLAAPLHFEAGEDGSIARVQFSRMELGEPDESGRRRPLPTGEEFTVDADTVVLAIGYGTDDEVVRNAKGIETDQWSLVSVNQDTFETSRPGVFAGGDCVNGADLVVTALADGRRAATTIHEYLEGLPSRQPTAITGITS